MVPKQPNILFILTDDHAAHAISAYGSLINRTPQIDRIAERGVRFENCFCTNAICTPARASILTGTFNHVNHVTTLTTHLDNRLPTFPGQLRKAGYQTAVYGKWHLGEEVGTLPNPGHFDDWAVFPGQGLYHNPDFIFPTADGGEIRSVTGYATDLVTDMALDFLERRDQTKPFCLLTWHKAPHRPWEPDEKHLPLFVGEEIPEPSTLMDDYSGRSPFAAAAHMRIGLDMNPSDVKCALNKNLPEEELRRWAYQRYIKDYLRVVASVDENVGRLLDTLESSGLAEDTIVIYSSDQGFFLGDHGWYDKRFMYEESLRMPLLVSYPKELTAGQVVEGIVTNVDIAPTLLRLCGCEDMPEMQGRDFTPLMVGKEPEDWPQSMYYRYWMNGSNHNVAAHYGIRTHTHKLIYFYNEGLDQPGSDGGLCGRIAADTHTLHGMQPAWELYDLINDPHELQNIYEDSGNGELVKELKRQLRNWQARIGDQAVQEVG